IVDEMQPEAELKQVRLILENASEPAKVSLNPKRFSRIFYNLINNSCDFMPKGGVISIRCRANAHEVITELQDTGPGFSAEIAQHLFEPFATHGKAHGSGLGLSICKRIVEDHQGWISARNGDNGGALFSIGLPLVMAR